MSRRMLKKEGRRCSPQARRLGVLIPRKESNAMKTNITTATALPSAVLEPVLGPVGKAFEEVSASFDRFCLAAGIAALGEMMDKDAANACGPRHSRGEGLAIGGGVRGARSPFMPVRWKSSGRGCAILLATSWRCRVGSTRRGRSGLANGR